MNTENTKTLEQLAEDNRERLEELGDNNNAGTFRGLTYHNEQYLLAVYTFALIGIDNHAENLEPKFVKHIFQHTDGNSELETRFANIQRAQDRGLLDKYDLRELSTRATAKVLEKQLKISIGTKGNIRGTNFQIDPRRTIAENAKRIKDELRSIFGFMIKARQYFRYYQLGRNVYYLKDTGKTFLKFKAEQPTRVLQLALEGYHKRKVTYAEAKETVSEHGNGSAHNHSYEINLSDINISIKQYKNGLCKLKAPSDVLQFVESQMEEITRLHRAMNSNKDTDHGGNRHLF